MKESKRALNDEIRAKNVQLITEDWENLGTISLREARERAIESWLDLMEIWRKDDVAIVKILDYWKYLYKLKKQEQKNKQRTKAPELKTIRITFNISDHDLDIRKKQAHGFAEDGNPLKVSLMMRWRENQYADLAKTKMINFVKSLEDIYKIEKDIMHSWNTITVSLKTIK